MKTVETFPFLTAEAQRLTSNGWTLIDEDSSRPLPDKLSGLDDMSVLSLHREIVVDVDALRQDCGIILGARLDLVASFSSSGTYIKRLLCAHVLPISGRAVPITLSGLVPSCDIASTLAVETKIILGASGNEENPLAASFAGSVLWRDRREVSLDEADAFFPMQLSDFNEESLLTEPLAGWRLLWATHDFERPFLGNVTLLINSLHTSVARAASGHGGNRQSRYFAIRQAVYFDVARELILRGLRQPDFVERDGEYDDGTCGRVLNDLIRTTFPVEKLSALSGMAETTPELFSSVLQARLVVFEEL